MLVKSTKSWQVPEAKATPESTYLNRRNLLAGMGVLGLMACDAGSGTNQAEAAVSPQSPAGGFVDPTADLYPATQLTDYKPGRALTSESDALTYNNFYEFGSHKKIAKAAQKLPLRPWTVTIDGLVEKEMTLDIDGLIRQMQLEERVYRFRCVEAWAMTVPWTGFPLADLVKLARPLTSAKYLQMQTFENKKVAPGQKEYWYPWPYTEGLTLAEATNELAMMVTGIYGKPLPPQNGAPLRLIVPWKYGFKNVKSIVRFTFTDKRPQTFWEKIGPREYGFWANINPEVAHPRWSQASERLLGSDERVPTQLFNGYAEQVAGLYADMSGEKLYR